MLPKLTIEEFYKIKERLKNKMEELQKKIEEVYSTLSEDEELEFQISLVKEYETVQKELLKYDLSDIPFDAWEGIALMSTEDLDLSPTHANIDFSIVEVGIQGNIILKGCKVRSLDKYYGNLKEENVDKEIIEDYPNIFLSELFSSDFRNRFLSKQITINDLKNLTPEQVAELKNKNYIDAIPTQKSKRDNFVKKILSVIPLEKIVYLLNLDEELLKDAAVLASTENAYGVIDEDNKIVKVLLEENSIDAIQTKINEIFQQRILDPNASDKTIKTELFSDRFKKQNSNIFINMENYPEDLRTKMIDQRLTLEDLITYSEHLRNINVVPFMDQIGYYSFSGRIINILGKHLSFLAASFPTLFQKLEIILDGSYSVFDNFASLYTNQVANINDNNLEEIKHLFVTSVLKAHFNKENIYEFSPNATSDIYAETLYPDWMKSTGYYVSKVKRANGTYDSPIDLISSKTIIEDDELETLFYTLGYENIKRLEKNNYYFSPRVIKYLVDTIETIDEVKRPENYDEFIELLIHLTYHANPYYRQELLKGLNKIKDVLLEEQDKYILPKDAPVALEDWYNRGEYNLIHILRNEQWRPYISKLDLLKIGAYLKINIYNSGHANAIPMELNFVELFLQENTQEELLDFLFKYRDYFLYKDYKYLIDIKDLSKEAIEQSFIQNLVKEITGRNKVIISENSTETFKNQHPDFFLSPDAPELLKDYFYNRRLSLALIRLNPEWIPYLENVNINLIDGLLLNIYGYYKDENGMFVDLKLSELYIEKFGLRAYLDFIVEYPELPNYYRSADAISLEGTSKEEIEKGIQDSFNIAISTTKINYSEDISPEFRERFPMLFLPGNSPKELKEAFYSRKLLFSDIRKNPEFIEYMKDIDLFSTFNSDRFTLWMDDIYSKPRITIKEVLNFISKDQFLELLSLYGEYFAYLRLRIENFEGKSYSELKTMIQEKIIEAIKYPSNPGNYLFYQEDAPDFIKEALPDYFLDPSAPLELKNHFYRANVEPPVNTINFELLSTHKEWHPYLNGKNLIAALNKINVVVKRDSSIKFVELFGQDTALNLCTKRSETVLKMIKDNKVDIMYEWWLKTGKKFIPDFTVMQLFSIEEADKFLSHGKDWSLLMKNKRFSTTQEGKEAMIKLAYAFGVFDGDQQGSKKLDTLLNDIPKVLKQSDMELLFQTEELINTPDSLEIKPGIEEYQQLRETLASEGLTITSNSIFEELYRNNGNGTYTLTINSQEYPKSRELLRTFMEKNNISMVISVARAHTLFGAFNLIYDRDFREFLLKNLEVFITNPDYFKYISSIQKQFQLIKTINSNRVLTPELAVSFVKENKYENIEVGNEELSKVSGIAGYSQEEFEILQKIYNAGKTRVASSIPRIIGTLDNYTYEILRLTDPLAVAIGTLSDCCQELNNVAEMCMIHSMVDKHGRVFVIRDEEGNIVAQSWVWRNKDVVCFDNIEIPDKVFDRARKQENPMSRSEVAEKVYEIYKKAAQDLIEADEKIYKELLDSGKITQEQYDSLRISKVTVGLGYNDIKEALENNAPKDEGKLSRPLEFISPVYSNRSLYTDDSTNQRVLEQREDRVIPASTSPTITAHYDEYEIYDKSNISKEIIFAINRLEAITGRYSYEMNTTVDDVSSSETIMEELSYNYGTIIDNTKIITNPNFCIIYEETSDKIKIVDVISLLQKVNQDISDTLKEKVTLQMKIAILQLLKSGKNINTDSLGQKELELITSIMNLPESSLDRERGITYGTI